MLEHWKKTGLLGLIEDAYERGVIVCGLSAGAICWFENMYTDSALIEIGESYSIYSGLGWIKSTISPHYGLRMLDFDRIILYNNKDAVGLEDRSAIEITDGKIVRSISCGGNAYFLHPKDGKVEKTLIEPCIRL